MEETVKKYIYSLLTSSPLTITIQQLVKDYRNTIGDAIPYHKLGYNSIEHFLRSIPDTVVLNGSGPGAQVLPVTINHNKSAHVNELVTHQRVNKKPFSGSRPRKNMVFVPPALMKRKILYPPPSTQSRLPNPSPKLPINKSSDMRESKEEKPPNKTPPPPVTNNSISNTITNPIINSVNTNSQKIANSAKKHTCPEPELVKVTNESRRIPYIDNKSNLNKNSSRSYGNEKLQLPIEKSEKMVPPSLRNNLKLLISRFPNGIWCAEVPSTYRKMFNQDLKYQELGFRNLIDLCSSLSTVFHYCRPSTEDFKLYDRSRALPECAEKKFTIASYSTSNESETENTDNALPSIDWLDVLSFLPEGVFKPGNEIPRTFIPTNTKIDDCFNIRAGEVFDLSKFWVYIDDGKLDTLMDDLQIFYQNNATIYLMPENLIREGIYCVQMIFNEYHRALIVDVLPEIEGTIRVVFIDYGTTAKVSIKGLCYLHNDFAQLPAQAIRCRLFNILPPEQGMPWTREASAFFRQSIVNKDLVMRIARINWQENYLEIYLADVSEKSKIFYINEYLVEKGYAIFSDQEQTRTISLQSSIVKYIHLFPTFLELEFGVAPSAQEMEVFYDLNIPINFTYPQYFKFDFEFEEKNIKSVQEIYETSCGSKKRDKNMHFYNHSLLNSEPFNMSIFGTIQNEVKEHMDGNYSTEFSEVYVGPDEEKMTNSVSSTSDDEILECVTALKKDCMLAEDIVKDLEELCIIGSNNQKRLWPSSKENCIDSFIFNNLDEASEYRNFSSISQTLDESEVISEEFVHPLSEMTFDNSNTCSPESTIESLNFEDPVGEEDQTEFHEVAVSPYFKDIEAEIEEIEDELDSMSLQDTTDSMSLQDSTKNKSKSTNPFFQDICGESENNLALQVVNPNNPFLNYLEETDDCEHSDESSNSTVYGTYSEEINAKKTWSTHDSGTTDELNVLETVSCVSSTSDSYNANSFHSAQFYDDNDDVKSFRSVPNNFRYPTSSSDFIPQQFPPHPYRQEYSYQHNWPTNYASPYQPPYNPGYPGFNPHYMQNQCGPYGYGSYPYGYHQPYYPQLQPQFQPQFQPQPVRPTRPAICPPPGFESNSNVHIGSFGRAHNISVPVLPGTSVQTITRSTTVNLHTIGDKDFYEMYNQQLQSKLKLQEDK